MIELLYMSQKDVIACCPSLVDAVDIAEGALKEHAAGSVEGPPKPGIHPRPEAFIHAMPAWLADRRAAGIKWVSGFPSNPAEGLPTITGLIILNDVDTGFPVAVMDGAYITAIRTAAVTGVAVRHLARTEASVAGLVGAGVQGRLHLLLLGDLLPSLDVVRIFDTDPARLEQFVSELGARLPFALEAMDSAQAALDGADILMTATGHVDERLFKDRWIKTGALALPIHSRGWETEAILKADRFVLDDWDQFSASLGGPDGYYAPLREPDAQLGEIALGVKPGRLNDDERIIDFNYGMALQDIALASVVVEKAKQLGLGQTLELQSEEMPLP